MTTRSIAFYLAAFSSHLIAAEPLAFPGCEGAGSHTTGGRGGSVYIVTNLNTEGPGSLADAVSQPGRIVTFAVSGIIDLTSGKESKPNGGRLIIEHPGITILGQTAPGEGICFKGGALVISNGNVILRHLRSRRGFIRDTDTGDAIEIKPLSIGIKDAPTGQSQADFEKIKKKKEERGKQMSAFAAIDSIVLDHCSASWATDENMTITHADKTSVSYCIAAEGLDYRNEKQTPMNHAEGSLWGSSAPDGRATMHHTLYAHNRLRNPRTVGGSDIPPILTLYNSVVYDWSEYPTHTGSERIHLQWLNNYYKPGPSTPADSRSIGFEFHGDPLARIYAQGNVMEGSDAASHDNSKAIDWHQKLSKLSADERAAMIVAQPFTELPALQTAGDAFTSIQDQAGATLPARDAVDLRILHQVRDGTGHVIGKETDLPEAQRWPKYCSLPAPTDTDHDGLPDAWEKAFGYNPSDAKDSAQIAADGYAAIEHYANNTDPTGKARQIVSISATVSRASAAQQGEWLLHHTQDFGMEHVAVKYHVSGDAVPGTDYEPLPGSYNFGGCQALPVIQLKLLPGAHAGRQVIITLDDAASTHVVGCPAASIIVLE